MVFAVQPPYTSHSGVSHISRFIASRELALRLPVDTVGEDDIREAIAKEDWRPGKLRRVLILMRPIGCVPF